MFGNAPVPFTVSWSGEADFYVADCPHARLRAICQSVAPGSGKPQFGKPHSQRQREAIARRLCDLSGRSLKNRTKVSLSHARVRSNGAEGPCIMQVEPLVHRECGARCIRFCPSLKRDIETGSLMVRQINRYRVQFAIRTRNTSRITSPATSPPHRQDCWSRQGRAPVMGRSGSSMAGKSSRMKHAIPDEALDDRLAFIGTSGSGKSYNAGGAVERVLSKGGRVVTIDPLGVWWGLRLLADGKTPSPHDVVIFGGPHGDLPITEHAGGLIGETVAGMAESCVLDLCQLGTKAAERRFMLSFLTAFYRHAAGEPVHVVFDEADMWAPQRLLDREGDAAKLLGMMETLVRRGRIKGFIPWLITQRPAVLSKDVLSMADGLVAFKLVSSQDRDAIGAWVEGSADKQQWREIWASLPTMQGGQGVVWAPARGILSTVKFPEKLTFDSSRTPTRGQSKRTAKLTPINLDKLQERLATVKAEVDANDPKALRAEVGRLKAELAKQPASAPGVDAAAIAAAEQRGYLTGFEEAKNQGAIAFESLKAMVRSTMQSFATSFDGNVRGETIEFGMALQQSGSPASIQAPAPTRQPVVPPAARQSSPAVSGGGNLSGPEQRIIDSLMTWATWGHYQPSNSQVAWLAGYSPSSSSYANPRGALKSKGLLEYPAPDTLQFDARRLTRRRSDGNERFTCRLGPVETVGTGSAHPSRGR